MYCRKSVGPRMEPQTLALTGHFLKDTLSITIESYISLREDEASTNTRFEVL